MIGQHNYIFVLGFLLQLRWLVRWTDNLHLNVDWRCAWLFGRCWCYCCCCDGNSSFRSFFSMFARFTHFASFQSSVTLRMSCCSHNHTSSLPILCRTVFFGLGSAATRQTHFGSPDFMICQLAHFFPRLLSGIVPGREGDSDGNTTF